MKDDSSVSNQFTRVLNYLNTTSHKIHLANAMCGRGDLGNVIPNPSEQDKLLTKCGKIVDLSKCFMYQIFASYPCNCNQFLHCSSNVVHKMNCSAGLVFNPENDQCDYPRNTDTSYCEDTSVTKSRLN